MSRHVALALVSLVAWSPCAIGQQDQDEGVVVRNTVEGLTVILALQPDGSIVKQGDVVCELDSARFQERLRVQQVETAQADADREVSKKNLEVALSEMAKVRVIVAEELATLQREVQIAELDCKIGEESLEQIRASRATAQGATAIDERRAIDHLNRCELTLDKHTARLKAYQDFTQKRRVSDAEIAVKRAESDEKTKVALQKLQRSRQSHFETMIANCKVVAPRDGRIVYPEPVEIRQVWHEIAEGAEVRQREILFRIVPTGPAR